MEGIKNIYFKQSSQVTEIEKDEYMIFPVYQIFGSEELSSVSPSVINRIQEPFILMNMNDAGNIFVNDGDMVLLEILNVELKAKVRIQNSIDQGFAGLTVNLPGMPFISLPGRGKFHKL
jgi:NADH-quinone oxidoreductase subunit G